MNNPSEGVKGIGKIKIDSQTSILLDSLRGLSAIIVFIAHFNQIFNLPIIGLNGFYHLFFGTMARYAVICFFVLSGFLITSSLLNNIQKNSVFNSLDFFKKRFARIYPPLVFSLVLSMIIYLLANYFGLHGSTTFKTPDDLYLARERFSMTPDYYSKTLFLLNGIVKGYPGSISMNGPLWSVSYEWWLYILAMLFTLWVKNRKIILGLIPFTLFVYYTTYSENFIFLWFALIWLIGCILFFIYRDIKINRRVLWSVSVLIFFGFVLPILFLDWKIIVPDDSNKSMAFQVLVSILLILQLVLNKNWVTFLLKVFRKTAFFSYTLYVIHFPLLLLCYSFLHHIYQDADNVLRFLVFVSVSALIIVVSNFLSKFLENRVFFIRLINKKE